MSESDLTFPGEAGVPAAPARGARAGVAPAEGRGPVARLARRAVLARLAGLREGELRLVEAGRVHRFGGAQPGPRATVTVTGPGFWSALALRGAIGGAEAFMDGLWRADDLTAALRLLARNGAALRALDGGAARLAQLPLAALHRLRANTRSGSRRNIAAHYDLGNAFFERFLDPTLTYSAGLFERPDASMEEASLAKYARIARELDLRAEHHVLEIGSGWGGFAIWAASEIGCRVTTTTISRSQLERARERVAAAGLADRVEVRFEDYRELRGEYDRLVSIEMIEAVGRRQLPQFFRVCADRLRPDGAMLLQAITLHDRDWEESGRSVDFIQRYVFPGGDLVAVGALCAAAGAGSDLQLTRLRDFTPHYAETLRRWRARFEAARGSLGELGLDQRFARMWEYYLCYCEAGFEERVIGLVQARFEKPRARLP